ncbi:unnamed protein product [Parascedosporium putredinis]|uniref:Uncharacterized protein n=1 Tax=Parascedosporium putredinis TaxID=1442378 RepID=A0A9P1GXE6_9PEZI|nr:unnamed protein product [Parascedosporium putredinis]CAI7990518.1 unnamed protein product [Parascedosporium putredinis]
MLKLAENRMRFAHVANQTISYFAAAAISTELRAKMQTLRRDTGQDDISDASGCNRETSGVRTSGSHSTRASQTMHAIEQQN